jgi:NAD(P)H-dependent FMN reductase
MWFFEAARRHERFEVSLADLAVVALPLIDEPAHPSLRKYEHQHTKDWSARVNAADAFVFVTPEYNYSAAPSLINALDYLYHEWSYKPAAFVSYGGLAGGMRSVQMVKGVVTTLKMMPIPEAVAIPMVSTLVKDGVFTAQEVHEKSARTMLDELFKWANALRALR